MSAAADIFLGLIGTIFLWHGLWNLCDLLEEQLGIGNKKIESSAFFTAAGIIMVLVESHKNTFHKILNTLN